MTEDSSVRVSLMQLLDLALGTPEVGSVNFNILHNLLHILLTELNLANNNVEYRGDNANRIKNALAVLKAGPSLPLEAHSVTDGASNDKETLDASDTPNLPTADPSNGVHDEQTVPPAESATEPSDDQSNPLSLPILSAEVSQLNDRLSQVEKNFLYLNDDVTELRNTVGAQRQPSTIPPAVPEGVESSDKTEQPIAGEKSSSDDHDKGEKVVGSQSQLSQRTSSISKGRSVIAGVDLIELQTDVSDLKTEMARAKNDIQLVQSQIVQMGGTKSDADFPTEKVISETPIDDVAPLVDADKDDNVPGEEGDATPQDTQLPSPIDAPADQVHLDDQIIPSSNSGDIDKNAKTELTEAVQNMEIIYSEAVRNLEFRVAELEKEMKTLNESSSNQQVGGPEGIQAIQGLVTKIQDAYVDMEKINQTAARLIGEEEQRATNTNVLIEQIELLKTIKADKEDLEDALADKADASTVNKKVSYDRFNNACDDLARGLEDAISKLNKQEYIWQQSLDTVQQEIDNKLDRVEISPIREFMNNRLQALQEKIKELAKKKNENEAAGTRKVLTGLHCISCDKNAVMKIEQGPNHQHVAVPPTRNIKPYLTYELDQIRKQQKKFPGKNMNHLNAAMQEIRRRTKPLIRDFVTEKTSRDHLCNRYCGGSHTVTTPQQRVMRMGHFLAQWGPEADELTQGVVRGTDGQLYHSRPMPPGASVVGNRDVCGPGANACCGMQSTNSPNQQMQPNRFSPTSESAQTSQRHSSHKEKRRDDSIPQPTPRLSAKQPILSEGPVESPTAPSPAGINHDDHYDETPRQIDEDRYEVSPEEI